MLAAYHFGDLFVSERAACTDQSGAFTLMAGRLAF